MSASKKFVGPVIAALGVSIVGCGGTQTGDMSGYNTGSRTLDTSTVSPATSLSAATLGSKLLPLIAGKPGFVAGLNVASFGSQPDSELGKNPLLPNAEVSYNSKLVNSAFQDMASIGSNVVRIRLFQKLDGLKLDSNGLVTGLDDTFQKNLTDLLDKAENSKLQLYVCISNSWSEFMTAKDPVLDTNARNAFYKKAIVPLVVKLKGRSGVFAIDAFNEIESEVAGKDGNSTDQGATWDQARAYIKSAVETIKSVDPQRLVSSSSGLHGWDNVKAGKFSKLNLDFYDFHVYDDKGILPAAKDLRVDRPVLVGSCGQSSKKEDNDVQAKADVWFLESALKQGYAGALVSEYGKSTENALSLLDKDGKHRPILTQFQSFVASLPSPAMSGTGLGR